MDVSLLSLTIRLVVSLGVVLLLVRLASTLLQRSGGAGPRRRRGPAEVEILLRQPINRRASVAVLRAGDRALVLGVTDQQVTLLHEDHPDVLVPPAPETPRTASPGDGLTAAHPTWTALVEALRDRTVRRS